MLLVGACAFPPTARAPDSASSRSTPARLSAATRGEIEGIFQYAAEVRGKAIVPVLSRVAARVDQLYVDLGSSVRQGETLGELDRSGSEAEVARLQADLAAAEANLAVVKAGPRPEVVAKAEADLQQARARLQALQAISSASGPGQAQASLEAARRRLAELDAARTDSLARAEALVVAAGARLDQLLSSPGQLDRQQVEQARASLRTAGAQVASARQASASPEVLAAREELVKAEQRVLLGQAPSGGFYELELARAGVAAAERQLALARAPPAEPQVRAAEAVMQQASAALEAARERLRAASLVAPIDGIVAERHLGRGDMASPGMPVLGLMPPEVELLVEAREAVLPHLAVGRPVAVAVEAYPGESFAGEVKAIAPVVGSRSRTALLKIEVADPRAKLRPGMFAQLQISIPKRPGRLLVPSEAVVRDGPDSYVFSVAGGRVRRQKIETGVTDGRNVEVLEGLVEGVQVVLSPSQGLADGDLVSVR